MDYLQYISDYMQTDKGAKTVKSADKIYDGICAYFKLNMRDFNTDIATRSVTGKVDCNGTEINLYTAVDVDYSELLFISVMPFPNEKFTNMPLLHYALNKINIGLMQGCFYYENSYGKAVYRMESNFGETPFTEKEIEYVIAHAVTTAYSFMDVLAAVCNGEIKSAEELDKYFEEE